MKDFIFKSTRTGRTRILRASSIWLIALLVTGCVGSTVNMKESISNETDIDANQGIVVVRVVNASSIPLPLNYLTLAPKNLNASETIKPEQLQNLKNTVGDSSYFIANVPAGSYSISNLRSYHSNGEYWYSRWIQGKIELGTFSVKAGGLIDLGTLIYYPKSQGDSYVQTLLRSPASNNAAFIGQYAPYLNYENARVTRWDDDGLDDERYAQYASVVQNPVTYNKRYLSPDGSLYFVGKLGYILKRTAGGEWQTDAVETDADLYAIAENEKGDKLVGGEHGGLFLQRAGSTEWNSISVDPTLAIQSILPNQQGSFDFIAWNRSVANVFRIASLDTLEPILIKQFKSGTGWVDPEGGVEYRPKYPTNGNYRYNLSYVNAHNMQGKNLLFIGEVNFYGNDFNYLKSTQRKNALLFDSETWEAKPFSNFGEGVDKVVSGGASDLGINEAGAWSMSGRDKYLRYDAGNSDWVPIKTSYDLCPNHPPSATACKINGKRVNRKVPFSFISVPVFSSDLDAIAFGKLRSNHKTEAEDARVRVLKTNDGGKSWIKIGNTLPGKYCGSTIPEIEGILLVSCKGFSSDFYQSGDSGLTWHHVRQTENF